MDPFSLTVGALSILGVSVGTCAKLLRDLRSKYKNAGLTIASIATECVTIQAALCQIERFTEADPEQYITRLEIRPDLKYALDTAITGCTTTFAVLEDELGKLADESTRKGKVQYLWNESTMKELLSQIRSQYSAINFLMMAIQSESIVQCTDLIRDTVPVLQQIARQTKALRETQPRARQAVAESIFSGSSSDSKLNLVNSTVDSLEFAFDSQVINSKAYRRAFTQARNRGQSSSAVSTELPVSSLAATSTKATGAAEADVVIQHRDSLQMKPVSGLYNENASQHKDEEISIAQPAMSHSTAESLSPEPPAPSNQQTLSTSANFPGADLGMGSFKCDLCQTRFDRAYKLRSHLRTHTNERPYSCTECGKAFARVHDCKVHENTHSKKNGPTYESLGTTNPRSSRDTYSSTESDDSSEPKAQLGAFNPDLRPLQDGDELKNIRESTPQDFRSFFPSLKRLLIRHDDQTYDGNMNLRVEVEARDSASGRELVQLFHLRMHDLQKRQFSLRRHCRRSGREVCNYVRKRIISKPPASMTRVHQSMSGIMDGLRRRTSRSVASFSSSRGHSTSTHGSVASSGESAPSRPDSISSRSGHEDEDSEEDVDEKTPVEISLLSKTIVLNFSNYAKVEVHRKGSKVSKRYEFEYWGNAYKWKRVKENGSMNTYYSYHLLKGDSTQAVAHIVVNMLSPSQIRDEEHAGGWVWPCSMWISDQNILDATTDVADIVVATGLAALVDDSINRKFLPKPQRST